MVFDIEAAYKTEIKTIIVTEMLEKYLRDEAKEVPTSRTVSARRPTTSLSVRTRGRSWKKRERWALRL
jgi:hypothetical protein